MKKQQGMEQMVFSYAYYKIKDYSKTLSFFKEMEKRRLFNIDSHDVESQELNGTFLMDYPKGHWNPFSQMPGAKQVIGSIEIKDGILKCEAHTKSRLVGLRSLLNESLEDAIEFEKEEYQDPLEMFRKQS